MPEPTADTSPRPARQHAFQPPRGTRDFYPADMLRRLWIESRWRAVSTRHGFDEIDGPRFEHADLYTVKSGDGILSELFSFRRWAPGEGPLALPSPPGKDAGGEGSPPRSSARSDAETWYALRPEFTPTLARMVAARAGSLPKPTKWFSVGPYFRAERPQRGRLREFLQWNADIIGDDSPAADAELIACCVEMLRSAGLTRQDIRIRISDRRAIGAALQGSAGVREEQLPAALALLDRRGKVSDHEFDDLARVADLYGARIRSVIDGADGSRDIADLLLGDSLPAALNALGLSDWCDADPSIVRGLAYYTGMVFEVHEATGAERAIAGGGRYDNLVSLFGGPATPAVGFAMGDVVLANVLQDKGLMPSDEQLREELGLRPDVFVISTADDAGEAALPGLVADLRRAGLHARHTYKSTRNIGKLIKEAAALGARTAFIIESPDAGTLKLLATGAQQTGVPVADLARRLREISDAATP